MSLGQQGLLVPAEGPCVTLRRAVSSHPLCCCELVLSRGWWGPAAARVIRHVLSPLGGTSGLDSVIVPGHAQKQLCAAPHPWGTFTCRGLGAKVFGSEAGFFG